jgi:hypothetical protein
VLVVCATVASGMGVDKADVRFVAHWNVSTSLTAYSQEVGRAGRDGCAAECMVLYSNDDVTAMPSVMENAATAAVREALPALYAMQHWCLDDTFCLHATLAAHFTGGHASVSNVRQHVRQLWSRVRMIPAMNCINPDLCSIPHYRSSYSGSGAADMSGSADASTWPGLELFNDPMATGGATRCQRSKCHITCATQTQRLLRPLPSIVHIAHIHILGLLFVLVVRSLVCRHLL